MLSFYTDSAAQTIAAGKLIGSFLKKGDVLALQGTLAAGKTTLTKGIALALDISENLTSPTFTLISEYGGSLPLYHMDVYRLNGADDFLDLGAEELLCGDGICVIEWSEKIIDVLPQETIIIKIETIKNEQRKITIQNWNYKNEFTEAAASAGFLKEALL